LFQVSDEKAQQLNPHISLRHALSRFDAVPFGFENSTDSPNEKRFKTAAPVKCSG
jgi:hypothetical protein